MPIWDLLLFTFVITLRIPISSEALHRDTIAAHFDVEFLTRNSVQYSLSLEYTSVPNGSWIPHERFVNQMRVCVDGTANCAAPSANGSHTIRRKPKSVGFLREHKENLMRRLSFPCTGVLCSPHVRGKLINQKRGARVYKALGVVQHVTLSCLNCHFCL